MADYLMRVHGRQPGGFGYSWGIFITSNQPPATLETTMAAALTDFWTNGTYGLGAQYAAGTTLDNFDIYELDGTFKATTRRNMALTLVGTSGDNPLPDSSTLTIKKVSTSVKRNGRGFIKLPAPVEGVLVNGFYTSAARLRFEQAAESLLTALNADGSTIFVHVGKDDTKGGVPKYTKTVISAMKASNKPGSNRARTRKQVGVYV